MGNRRKTIKTTRKQFYEKDGYFYLEQRQGSIDKKNIKDLNSISDTYGNINRSAH